MDNPRDLWRQIEPSLLDVEEISFAGGEPLIQIEHYWVLEHLLRNGRRGVRLKYNTNFSITEFQGRDVMTLWAQFEHVQVGASLDASGKRGEYLRKGQSWERVLANRAKMRRICQRACFNVNTTVTAFNALHIPDFHKELVESGFIGCEEIYLSLLLNPEEYRIQVLPSDLKNAIAQKYERHIEEFIRPRCRKQDCAGIPKDSHCLSWDAESLYRHVVRFMQERDLSGRLGHFFERTSNLDRLQGERLLAVFPELAPARFPRRLNEQLV